MTEEPKEIELQTRVLNWHECFEVHDWIANLECFNFSSDDAADALKHLLASKRAIVSLPADMESEAIYFKLKWG